MVEFTDLHHLRNGSHAGDGVFGERADAKGDGAQQLAVNVNRAAAHAGHYSGIFRLFAAQAHQHHVALGAVLVAEHAQHLNAHGLGLGSLKYRIGNALHSGMHFIYGKELVLRNLRLGSGVFIGMALGKTQTSKENCGSNEQNSFFHHGACTRPGIDGGEDLLSCNGLIRLG